MIWSRIVNDTSEIFHSVLDFMVNAVLQFVVDDLEKYRALDDFAVILDLQTREEG